MTGPEVPATREQRREIRGAGETLAAGAPVSAHWVADRQSGPLLLRFGTEEQRQRFLPRIARGELAFAIGMSEPDSGSDLASVRTRAEKVAGGYKVTGTKIWTSNAHLSDYAIALFRSKVVPDKKHEGLSQFLVDLKSPGISIRPIIDLAGGHHFNEVHFQDCLVPDDMLVGKDGEGWKQVTTELGFERSGPERYLSSLQLVIELIREAGREPGERAAALIGHFTAHLVTLRQMSLSIATMLQAGQNPNLEAAVMKDIGPTFERRSRSRYTADRPSRASAAGPVRETLGYLVQHAPSFSLRGGTRKCCAAPSPAASGSGRGRHERAPDDSRRDMHAPLHPSRHHRGAGGGEKASGRRVCRRGGERAHLPQVTEARGGAGGSWNDAFLVLMAAALRGAGPAGRDLLAGAIMAEADLDARWGHDRGARAYR